MRVTTKPCFKIHSFKNCWNRKQKTNSTRNWKMSTSQFAYKDLEAKHETKETPEAVLLHVHIPDGFKREHIGAKIEYKLRRVRVHGDRWLGKNERARFNVLYDIPEYCDVHRITLKYDGNTAIITIPTIPETESNEEEDTQQESQETESNEEEDTQQESQETESNEEEDTQQESQETEPNQEDDEKEGSPTHDDQDKTVANDHVDEEEADRETSTPRPPMATQESMRQKVQEGISQNASKITKVESEKQVGDQETSATPKDTEESKPQKGHEEIPRKDEFTKVESKKQVVHEDSSSTPPEDTGESLPKKGQEAIIPKATLTKDAKLQAKEKFEGEKVDENEEKHKVIGKDKTEDHLESGKSHETGMVDDSFSTTRKEGQEKSKGLGTLVTDGKIVNDGVEKKSDNKKALHESITRTRIKEVTASASQAMTSRAKRFNDEDNKQRMVYLGAAVLVVALGVYATYKLRSRRS
ncbi:hypothetical protein Fmac_011790 [Flemingia macrophylla]|uniref:SHSP domain-containing protein n=1 Tax=Flemingia macrophylla TaxID=520843 RepID=A0ABD1MNG4_9FABA